MPTYFDTLDRNFTNVPIVDGEISTTEFLEAAEGVVKLFDLFGSTAFSVVQSDMTGNITKIRKQQLALGANGDTLQKIVKSEVGQKKRDATQGLLWLTRGLDFTSNAMRKNIDNPSQELTESFTKAYSETLSKYHSMMIRPVFKLAMKACPWRKDFYAKLGDLDASVEEQLEAWVAALENIVRIINEFYAEGNYGKGL